MSKQKQTTNSEDWIYENIAKQPEYWSNVQIKNTVENIFWQNKLQQVMNHACNKLNINLADFERETGQKPDFQMNADHVPDRKTLTAFLHWIKVTSVCELFRKELYIQLVIENPHLCSFTESTEAVNKYVHNLPKESLQMIILRYSGASEYVDQYMKKTIAELRTLIVDMIRQQTIWKSDVDLIRSLNQDFRANNKDFFSILYK